MATGMCLLTFLFLLVVFLPAVLGVNVAFRKDAVANATCGFPRELFYSVTERYKTPRQRIRSYCNGIDPNESHNATNLVDGQLSTWWQSPASVDKISITIDLRGVYQKYYYVNKVVIHFGEYYRPGQLAYYKSSDSGLSYQQWHYFVSSHDDCQEKFGVPVRIIPNSVNAVLCMPYTSAALEQNDVVSLLVVGPRGDVNSPSHDLLDWMNVTNIQLNFMSLRHIFDPRAVSWHHYAVREIEVDAYCLCNGQGDGSDCFYNETLGDNQCRCQTGACGIDCSVCCPAYNQYPWQQGGKGPLIADKDAACQPCNCHNHSYVCVYNETVARMNMSLDSEGNPSGGGVCQNCQDNTEGINCEKCVDFYYRPRNKSQWERNACQACNCSIPGTKNVSLPGMLYLDCLKDENTNPPRSGMEPGDCLCKNNTMTRQCDQCKPGFFNLSTENPSGCQECSCHISGTVNGSNVCEPDEVGLCPCKQNVEGAACDSCKDTYYNLQHINIYGCTECRCDIGGSVGPVCNKKSGQCLCKPHVTLLQCNSPEDQFYFPTLHFITGNSSHLTSEQGNQTWTTTLDIVDRVNKSGMFILLLSYTSTSNATVTITVHSTAELSRVVHLDVCDEPCNVNLSAFGVLMLTGSVVVNVTYKVDITGLSLIKVVALPREFYQPTLLGNSTMDDFLENCSVIQNTMGSGTNHQGFCLSQVYSLTIDYLGEALPCGCDSTGSVNGSCEKYAGQCHCKEGVTGRTCDRCIAGFYNFSSEGCSACECQGDNKVCDAVTGQCICPPNTEGRVCDKCSSNFWGWNQTVGCQACNCSEVGSADLQCNLTTGFCSCKPGVQGEKCIECVDGYKSFSNQGCSQCLCDGNGSLSEVCNKSSGQCPCKNNAVGQLCDRCQSGFFYLTNTNPDGCSSCVCMGISKNCSSTTSYRQQRDVELDVWSLGTAEATDPVSVSQDAFLDEDGGSVKMVAANITSNQTYYWRANSNFTDISLVEAYGGNFSFKLYFTQLANGTLKVLPPKVILQGIKNISIEQNLTLVSSGDVTLRQLVLKEVYWVHSNDYSAVSRAEFLLVLAKLQAVLITASYYTHGEGHYQTSLGAVQIASIGASPSKAAGRANDVEECQCGPGYSGLSCERCARGYHRVNLSSDQYLGKCVPCDCNGHSLDCDPATGQCLNCDHNTTGFHCELCLDGFYGNASVGTPGDCKTCPCESPRTLTTLCEADNTGQPRCLNCSEGYEGNICGSCIVGFFGEPLNPGGNCSRCQCFNNSDVCNTTTGECLHCQHNTTGFNCERCENGTWGAATQQQCQACTCDGVGAHHNICNHRTGECECKPFIGGGNCSMCEPYSYNFSSSGCTPCGCNPFGSRLLQCNDSGICECNNNTLGDKCDVCEWGFFGLPNSTCQECRCNATGANNFSRCDRVTGQCDCKPGVTTRTCDRCMIQHTNFSGNGCNACPLCSRLGLQGNLNATSRVLRKAQDDADTVSNLELLWPELTKVENLILQTKDSAKEFDKLVDGLQHNITQLKASTPNKTVATLQVLLSSISAESEHLANQLSRELTRIQRLHNNTQAAKSNLTATSTTVTEILTQLKTLKEHAESLLQGLDLLPNTSFDDEKQKVEEELVRVRSVEALAMTARYNVSTHSKMSADLNNSAQTADMNFKALKSELEELKRRIAAATNDSNKAFELVNEIKDLTRQGTKLTGDAKALLQTTDGMVNTTTERISHGQKSYENASHHLYGSDDRSGLIQQVDVLENSIRDVMADLSAANNSVQENATKHAANLTAEATQRQRVFNSTLSHGARAVEAIKTFDEVVQLGNRSLETSRQANKSLQEIMKRLENVTLVSSDLDTRVGDSKNESQDLLTQTLNREIDLQGLSSNVTASNQTFIRAVSTGLSVDGQYGVLSSRRDSLVQAAESGTNQPSYLLHTEEANMWSAEANARSNPVNIGARTLIDQVDRLEQKVLFINQSAEKAGILLPQAFEMVQNASISLRSTQNSVNEALNLRNITANLQEEIRRNMSALEDKLRRAKQFVAKIRLALNVEGNTAVQYRPAARIVNKTEFTEISVDFRAKRVRGSLFYLSEGSSMLDRSLSVTLENEAYVRFRYNLGSGPVDIINWEVKVKPGRWYTALASRYLSNGRLTVTDHKTNFSRTYESDSDLINRYLYTDFTSSDRLYVGGLPDGHMVNKTDRFFEGCIDNVVVNQQILELWNPVKVEGNRTFCSRRPSSEAPLSPGRSFFGIPHGHVKQKIGLFNITGYSEMEFEFRTFQETSLLTSVLNEQGYVYGVYLNGSRVVFHFKAGNRSYAVQTNDSSYTDGRWYRVHVIRGLTNASLTVRPVGPTHSGAVDHNTISIPGPLFLAGGLSLLFGGKDPNRTVKAPVSTSFAGDMRLINISTSSPGALVRRILNSANLTETFDGVDFSGTLSKVEKGIRFLGGGYAAVDIQQDSMIELLIRFKTLSPSGLLVYSGQGPYFYLSLFHGNIYMIYASNLTTFQPLMSSRETLNDGAYHTVKIEASPLGSQVFLDNKFLSGPNLDTGPIPLNGSLFIGGIDNTVNLSRALPVILPFKGDLRDIQLNGTALNIFSGRSERVSKAGVSLEDYVPPTELPTAPPPTLPPPTCGTPHPPLRNSSEVDGVRLELSGSYIAFSPNDELLNQIKRRFVMVIRFRSLVPNGVLLYAADDLQKPAHFLSVELVNGRVVFKYNANSTTVTVSGRFSNYSDGGVEYEVMLLRIDQFGALLVSNKDYKNERRGEKKPDLNIKAPFYYGGVPPGINMSVLEGKGVGFIGCLRTFIIEYNVPNKTEPESKSFNPRTDGDIQKSSYRYKPCYQEIQSQAGFHGNGHILFDDNYTLPDETEIMISFRSTTRSGLLISITSSSASVTLEQVMGQVVLTFNDEQNSSSSFVRWTDPSIPQDGQYNASFHLCDNNFHRVRFRRNFVAVELIVDNHAAVTEATPAHFSLKRGKFYVGGVPEGSGELAHSGLSRKGLTGCVQSLIIEGQAQDIVRNTQRNNVQLGCNAPR